MKLTKDEKMDRLLELYLNYINHVPSGEVPKEFHQLKSQILKELEIVERLKKLIKENSPYQKSITFKELQKILGEKNEL